MAKYFYNLILPILIILFISLFDIQIAGLFYEPGIKWKYFDHYFWHLMYHRGAAPVVIILITSGALLLLSFFIKKISKFRIHFLYLLTVIVVVQFFIIEPLKNTWGRPRPGEIKEFAGVYEYVMPFVPKFELFGNKHDGKSFPSSHGSAAFLPLALYFVFKDKYKKLAIGCFVFGMANGLAIGLTRMLQGAHFISDIATSFFIVFIIAKIAYEIFYNPKNDKNSEK